jgi:hypothetical protein
MNGWLDFWTIAMLISGALFLGITLVVAVGGFRDLQQMLREFSLASKHPQKDGSKHAE